MNELCPKSNKKKKNAYKVHWLCWTQLRRAKEKESVRDAKRVTRASLSLNIVFAKKKYKSKEKLTKECALPLSFIRSRCDAHVGLRSHKYCCLFVCMRVFILSHLSLSLYTMNAMTNLPVCFLWLRLAGDKESAQTNERARDWVPTWRDPKQQQQQVRAYVQKAKDKMVITQTYVCICINTNVMYVCI